MILAMMAGTIFLVWLGEQITEYGIGNGVSIIIFGGIVAGYPQMIGQGLLAMGNILGLFVYVLIVLVTILVIVIRTIST